MRRASWHQRLWAIATLLLFEVTAVTVAAAQLPMRVLGSHGVRVMLVGGDSLAPLDSLPPGEVLPQFKRCDAPTPPLGAARGTGTVIYTLLADGTVDTSTIEAVEARGMSFPGVESAATRVLGQCRFKPARMGRHAVPIRLAQIMKFETELPTIRNVVIRTQDAGTVGATTTMAEQGLGADTTTIIYDSKSLDLDETPRLRGCQSPLVPFSLSSVAATMSYVVDPEGTVDSGAVRISIDHTSATEAETAVYLRTLVAHCHYAPARVLGRPVPMVVEQKVMVRWQMN